MTGSVAERNLLGALISDPSQRARIDGLVSADDFEDARLGEVFDGIVSLIGRKRPVDAAIVDGALAGWGVRNMSGEPYEWANADVYAFAAPEYARSVRAAGVGRAVKDLLHVASDRLDSGVAPADVASGVLNRAQEIVDGGSTGLLKTKQLAEVLEGDDSYDWVIPDLLERKDRLIVTGPEGSGKTTWVRQLAILSAAGIHPTTFRPMLPVRVLVVDAENTERQWRRSTRWMTSHAARVGSVDPGRTVNIVAGHRIDLTRGPHLSEIHRLIDAHRPDVVFIGPLYKMVPKAINNDDDAAPLIVALDSLRDRNVALVMEAHAGKAASALGERDLRPRGSAALLGWPEFGFGLRPDPDDPDEAQLKRWRGDRDPNRMWPESMRRGGEWPWT